MNPTHWRQKIEDLKLKIATGWDILTDAINSFDNNGDTNQAAAVAFYAILSAIPLFILTFAMVGFVFNSYPNIKADITEALRQGFLSEKLLKQLGKIEKKRNVLGGAGLLGLIWLSSSIFDSLSTSLDIIFRSPKKRNFFVAKLHTIAMIPLAWFVGIASVTFSYITALLISRPPWFIKNLGFALSGASEIVLGYLVPYFITTLFLVVAYRVIPSVKIPLPVVIAGSAIAAFFLEIIKQFFTWYIANFTRYDVIFGSLTAVVILVVGVYYNALIFLFCSELMSSYLRRDILLLERAILKPDKPVIKVNERLFKKFGRVYEKDSIIFKEGDNGHEIFYVISGRVSLEKLDCHVRKVLAEMGPGQYFGEMASLINISRSATARASEKSSLAVIDGQILHNMLNTSQDGAVNMLREFSRRLINSNVILEESTNLWIYLAIIIYFMNHSHAKIDEHLPHLAAVIKKEPKQIRALLEDLIRQDVLIVKDSLVAEVSGKKMWTLLDSGKLSKCFIADSEKTDKWAY